MARSRSGRRRTPARGAGLTTRAFLGIDCGTQSTKTVVLDEAGTIVGAAHADHALIATRPGESMQDPAWWIEALKAAVRDAVGTAPPRTEIAGVGVSGQQHGLVTLGAGDAPLAPAPLWNDVTCAADCEALTEAIGGLGTALSLSGNAFLPGYTAGKLAHLRHADPEMYGAAARFCLPHDYLNLWLTGEFATEPGDASGTAFFDVRARGWCRPVLETIDPDADLVDRLAPVHRSLRVHGTLRAEAAEALGLATGVPVSGGGGDNMCAALGVGAVVPGRVVVSLGTSGTVFARADRPAVDPLGEAAAFCDSAGGWLPLACTMNAGGAADRVRELLARTWPQFEAAAAQAPPGADGLVFVPYLDGERTPNRPDATGAFVGLTGATMGPAHVARATLEGVTFGLRHAAEALGRAGVEVGDVTLVGGGASSDLWAQLVADAFAVPVFRPSRPEAAACGAAAQARAVVDAVPITEAAGIGPGDRFTPEADLSEAYARYRATVD